MTAAEIADWEEKRAEFYENEMSDEGREWHSVRDWEMNRSDEWSRQSVQDTIGSGAMLNVAPIFSKESKHVGFRVTFKGKGKNGTRVELTTYFKAGGLRDQMSGTVIFEQYEFSMHKYMNKLSSRAPTEYVRRKFANSMGQV